MASSPEVVSLEREHLPGVIELFSGERWSYAEDEQRTWRALTAPGTLSVVALSSEQTVIGIAQVLSDGEVQAFLAVLVVARAHRREGVARCLVEEARARTHGLRLDVISCADPFYEQLGFHRVSGFRLPPT
ncbi:MAG TPA: GNAT family N-acetyltransferase [Solirubrobacteraceae bacterium]|jgi:predicted N-acetyltransferase YhbS|nr:GNAT family N-acetyltransferase [Solirubrobacteraceae bacterium]